MSTCHEMQKGEAYACSHCGFEIVVQETCTCEPGCSDCSPEELSCCNQPLEKKES